MAQAAEDENRLEDTILSEEDRDETRLGDAAYTSRFLGRYGVDGSCDDHESVWVFSRESVAAGDLLCAGIGKMTWEDEGLVVPLSECRDRAADVDDRTIVIEGDVKDGLNVIVDNAELRLKPCG